MKYFVIGFTLTLSIFFLNCSEHKKEVSEAQISGVRVIAVDFMKDLKSVLIKQMQTNGVLQAVSVCSDTAQVLTNNFGVRTGVDIRRVSLKVRNSNNYPDEFEKRILNKFELLQQNNKLNNETEYVEIVVEGDYEYLRYLKPIIVQAECLNCHGSQAEMMPEVKNLITHNYPQDKAINYKSGDLRGAVSVKKVLQ